MRRKLLDWLLGVAAVAGLFGQNQWTTGTESAPEAKDATSVDIAATDGGPNGSAPALSTKARLPHPQDVFAVAMTPDGKTAVTGDDSAVIRLWDVPSGKEIAALSGHQGSVTALTISADGSLLASVGFDGIRLWRLPAGSAERYLPVNPGKTTWTRFAPDGKTLVSGGSSAHEPLRIWESATGREVKQFSAGYRGANCGAWSPDGLRLATGSLRAGDVAEVCIWEVATGRELLRVGGHPGGVQMIEFTADGRRIISADSTGELVVWDVQSGRLYYRRKIAHEKAISSLAISRDGVILASASRDRTVRLWELVTGQEITRFPGHEGTVKAVAIAADGRFGISGGLDAQAFLWDNSAGALENAPASPALTEAEREALWSDLCSPDAARAQRAGWVLTAHAESAVELIETRLRPLSTSQRSRIEQAVVELSHARGTVRRQAMEELRHLGESAEAPLRRARANRPSLDVRQRLDLLLEAIEGPVVSRETLAAVRSVQVLERLGSAAARRVLGELARGPDDDRTTIEANAAILRLSAAPAGTAESARVEPPVPARAQGNSASPTNSPVAQAQQPKEIRSSSTSQDSDAALALAAEIDRAIEADWHGTDVVAAPSADDAEFLRRVSLDLTGRIPLVYEARDFFGDPAADKRTRLIDQLVERPEHTEHLMARLRDLLLTFPGGPEESPVRLQALAPAMEQWLRESVRKNRPYDAMIHELLVTPLPDERLRDLAATSSPLGFYFQHDDLGLAGIAGDAARTFLGLKLECAECHNHPFARWSRKQFWEFTACFSGILIDGKDVGLKQMLGEDPLRRSLPLPGSDKTVTAGFPDGSAPAWQEGVATRELLAAWMTARGNLWFARTIVNRVWADFFGAGLVEPIDETNEQSATGRTDLLDLLARRFVDGGCNIRFLIRAIANSRTYQRTSRLTHESQREPQRLAKMTVRGLTADQLYDSLMQANGYREDLFPFGRPQANLSRSRTSRMAFAGRFAGASPPTDSEASMLEALFMMNGPLMESIAQPGRNETLDAVDACAGVADCVETLYLATLSRLPRPDEAARFVLHVENGIARGRRRAALADVFWVLLNSGEFMSNH